MEFYRDLVANKSQIKDTKNRFSTITIKQKKKEEKKKKKKEKKLEIKTGYDILLTMLQFLSLNLFFKHFLSVNRLYLQYLLLNIIKIIEHL